MKTKLFLLLTIVFAFTASVAYAQEKAKKAQESPRDSVSQTIASGATITINYGSPFLKGRKIGKDVEPNDGKIWRAGANQATTFQTDKNVKVEGQALPAGKYALFVTKQGADWTVTFNKVWKTWGVYDYEKNKGDDALSVKVKAGTASPAAEQLKYTIGKDGRVTLNWGEYAVSFKVE